MVLRSKAAFGHQRQGGYYPVDAHAGKRRRLGTAERQTITDKFFGKFFAYRGYISQDLFERLLVGDLHPVTKNKKNMKNSLVNLHGKLILRKRSIIETVSDKMKNVCQIERTRHRSVDNFATNLPAGLIVYNLLSKKPSINIDIIDKNRLIT